MNPVKDVPGIEPDTRTILERYNWPGNVRELENAMKYANTFCRNGALLPEHLPPKIPQAVLTSPSFPMVETSPVPQNGVAMSRAESDMGKTLKRFLRDKEIEYIQAVLDHVEGDKNAAANSLGISLATLYRKLPDPI